MNIGRGSLFRISGVLLAALLLIQPSVYAEGAARSGAPMGAKPTPKNVPVSANPSADFKQATPTPTTSPISLPPRSLSVTVPGMKEIEMRPMRPLRWWDLQMKWKKVKKSPLKAIQIPAFEFYPMVWRKEMSTFRMLTPRTSVPLLSQPSDRRVKSKSVPRRRDDPFAPHASRGKGTSGYSAPTP